MDNLLNFIKIKREESSYRPVSERIKDFADVALLPQPEHSSLQASRCMDCGIPFCHWACPLGNYIFEWNELVSKKQWYKAYQLLSQTNRFPEITGRLCPALCEYGCTLEINDQPVTIRENELAIIEYAFKEGYVEPRRSSKCTKKKVAIIGSGPAGLACADRLNRYGHKVVVFEKDDNFGGLLRYGVPDFKLEKWILDRRLEILRKEGIEFVRNVEVGKDIRVKKLLKEFDALVLACGCRVPRDLKIEGRELKGIYFALDYLVQANQRVSGIKINEQILIDAKDKKVVIIGGGDTGSDCVGVANRQGAKKVTQLEILPKPPSKRSLDCPWPNYPILFKTTSSHEEGCQRYWQVLTKKFLGENGKVEKLICVKINFEKDKNGCFRMKEIPGSEFEIEADLVILALGFLYPPKEGLIEEISLGLNEKGWVKTDLQFHTSQNKIFACGDMHRGPSLIVWAIHEGNLCADFVNNFLKTG